MSAQPEQISAQPEMNEKMLARMQKGAEPLLEPGETIRYGVMNMTMPMWVYAPFVGILILPYVLQKSSMTVVTDRNVYVLKWMGMGTKASKVLLKAPLGSVESHVDGNAFPGRYLLIGDQKIWLHWRRRVQDVAHAIAAAASGRGPAPSEQPAITEPPPTTEPPTDPAAARGEEGDLQQPSA